MERATVFAPVSGLERRLPKTFNSSIIRNNASVIREILGLKKVIIPAEGVALPEESLVRPRDRRHTYLSSPDQGLSYQRTRTSGDEIAFLRDFVRTLPIPGSSLPTDADIRTRITSLKSGPPLPIKQRLLKSLNRWIFSSSESTESRPLPGLTLIAPQFRGLPDITPTDESERIENIYFKGATNRPFDIYVKSTGEYGAPRIMFRKQGETSVYSLDMQQKPDRWHPEVKNQWHGAIRFSLPGIYEFKIEGEPNWQKIIVAPPYAERSFWYGIFPRSISSQKGIHGTFDDLTHNLSYIKKLSGRKAGESVLYLTPFHPIGRTNRKGPDDALIADPTDPGCPYAIGSHLVVPRSSFAGEYESLLVRPNVRSLFTSFNDGVVNAENIQTFFKDITSEEALSYLGGLIDIGYLRTSAKGLVTTDLFFQQGRTSIAKEGDHNSNLALKRIKEGFNRDLDFAQRLFNVLNNAYKDQVFLKFKSETTEERIRALGLGPKETAKLIEIFQVARSESGGHRAINPQLGTLKQFRFFVKKAQTRGLKVAYDWALNYSPDHPWVTEHPEFLKKRPDGTFLCAENPPKRYEDVYLLEFYPTNLDKFIVSLTRSAGISGNIPFSHLDINNFSDLARLLRSSNPSEVTKARIIAEKVIREYRKKPEIFRDISVSMRQVLEQNKIQNEASRRELWDSLKGDIVHWINQGVKLIRVDNPHKKPLAFWNWIIPEIKREHPEVVFLAEAFADDAIRRKLSVAGFDQTYDSYFPWSKHGYDQPRKMRTGLHGVAERQMMEKDYLRSNYWPATPDILVKDLVKHGMPAFKVRMALAAMMSPNWGIPSGLELIERTANIFKEEPADSEKYRLIVRDLSQRRLQSFVTMLNQIRSSNPALRQPNYFKLHSIDQGGLPANRHLFAFKKQVGDNIIIVVAKTRKGEQQGFLQLPLYEFGIDAHQDYYLKDLVSVRHFKAEGIPRAITGIPHYKRRGDSVYVKLTDEDPIHIFKFLKKTPNKYELEDPVEKGTYYFAGKKGSGFRSVHSFSAYERRESPSSLGGGDALSDTNEEVSRIFSTRSPGTVLGVRTRMHPISPSSPASPLRLVRRIKGKSK